MSPYEALPCTPSYTYVGENGVPYLFKNWNPYVNTAITMPIALAWSCDTYFYELGVRFYKLAVVAAPAVGEPFGFGASTGIELGPEATRPAPDAEVAPRLLQGSDREALEAGRLDPARDRPGDMTVTPLQMARFYAMIANGGQLVTPHVFKDVHEPERRVDRPAPDAADAEEDRRLVERARRSSARASSARRTTRTERRPAIFSSFPVEIAGKTGTAEKCVERVQTATFDQAWWCGYGPYDDPEIVVCALIENGGHGGTSAAPAALEVLRELLPRQGATRSASFLRRRPTDGRRLRRPRAARGARARRARAARRRSRGASTGSSSARSSRSSRTGSTSSPASRATTCRGAPTTTSIRQAVYAAVGGVAMLGASLLDPDLYRRYWRQLYAVSLLLLLLVIPLGTEARGSQRWIDVGSFTFQPSELGKLLVVLAVAGFLAERARRIGEVAHGARDDRARQRCRRCSSSCSPTSGRRSSTARRSLAMLFIAGTRWLHLGVILSTVALTAHARRLAAPVRRRGRARAVPARPPDRVRQPLARPAGRELQRPAVDPRDRRGRGPTAAASTTRRRRTSTTCPSTRPTSRSPRSQSSAASSARRSCSCSTCSSSGAGFASSRTPRDPYSAIVAGGIVFALLFQVFVNVGMTMGIAPVTGIPLPFVSVGGSSIVTNLLAIGVLQAIHARGRRR